MQLTYILLVGALVLMAALWLRSHESLKKFAEDNATSAAQLLAAVEGAKTGVAAGVVTVIQDISNIATGKQNGVVLIKQDDMAQLHDALALFLSMVNAVTGSAYSAAPTPVTPAPVAEAAPAPAPVPLTLTDPSLAPAA